LDLAGAEEDEDSVADDVADAGDEEDVAPTLLRLLQLTTFSRREKGYRQINLAGVAARRAKKDTVIVVVVVVVVVVNDVVAVVRGVGTLASERCLSH